MYAEELENAVQIARAEKRGLWQACPSAVYDPSNALNTGTFATGSATLNDSENEQGSLATKRDGNCSSHYQKCVPPFPPDYDCGDLVSLGLIHVIGQDVHRLDRDGDGLACESNAG